MKKMITMVLAAAMVFSMGVISFANQSAKPEEGDCFVTEEMIRESAERVEEMIAEGAMLRKIRAQQEKLAVPYLSQKDSRWKDVPIPGCNGKTYGKVGCAITCYTMMSRYFGNSSETPVTFGQKYYNKYGDPCWQSAVNAAALMGRSATAASKEKIADPILFENFLISAIDSGEPVIIKTNKFNSHYILAYGYYITSERNATIYIHDPEPYDKGTTLSDYKNYEKLSAVAIG